MYPFRLSETLDLARRRIPFYRERLAPWNPANPASFGLIPLLEKGEIAGQEHLLLPNGVEALALDEETTSGSSGLALRCFKGRRHRMDLVMRLWRIRAEYGGITPADRMAEFYGFIQEGSRFRTGEVELDYNGRSLCLSMLNLSPAALQRYYEALCQFQPRWFFSVPSALTTLSDYMLDRQLPGPATGIRYIEVSGEVLLDYQRTKIEAAFGCPVFNHYGSREFWLLAMSCPHGRLHIESDMVHTEFLPVTDQPAVAELVVTALQNENWPLIRYRLGDLVRPSASECPCGRPGPVLDAVEGRTTDLLRIGDWVANPILFHYAVTHTNALYPDTVRQFQVTQVEEARLEFRFVQGEGAVSESLRFLQDQVREKLPVQTVTRYDAVSDFQIPGRKHTYFRPIRGGAQR